MKPRKWFTRSQLVFLLVVVNAVLVIGGSLLLSKCSDEKGDGVGEALVNLPRETSSSSSDKSYAVPVAQRDSFLFDPNEADSTQLLRLGLAPFQVRSIYRYRAKGGRYSTKDDFRRVYRLTNEQWEHLEPLIRIAKKYQLVELKESADPRFLSPRRKTASADSVADTLPRRRDSLSHASPKPIYPQKLSGDETLDINLADSAQLCRVPGIGPYFSRKIVQYRKRLGGFASTEQLLQIDNFPADALAWMVVGDTLSLQKLPINRLSTRKLMKHPYMGYYRASEIANYRRIYGPIKSIDALRSMPHFTEADIARLAPYLSFE